MTMPAHARSPQVSIIIPAFNAERFIGRALRSVIGQSYMDSFEIIVVDDCSTDRTAFALELFKGEITLVRNEVKLGLPGSLNRAIRAARGKYIVRVDADDYVTHDYLYILQRFLEANTQMDAVACDYVIVDDSENVFERRNCMEHPIGCGIMFRSTQLIDIGLYDDDLLMHEDRDLRTRFLEKYTISRIELPLYRYRRHPGNMTNDRTAWDHYEDRLRAKHSGSTA
jgi:glycosyltransferase involved in cell wall biosynthesis